MQAQMMKTTVNARSRIDNGNWKLRSTVAQVTLVPVCMPRKMKAAVASHPGMPILTPASTAATQASMLPAIHGAGRPIHAHRAPPAAPMSNPCKTGLSFLPSFMAIEPQRRLR